MLHKYALSVYYPEIVIKKGSIFRAFAFLDNNFYALFSPPLIEGDYTDTFVYQIIEPSFTEPENLPHLVTLSCDIGKVSLFGKIESF